MQYRPEIDGLRALAVIPVILYHAGFRLFSGGYVGVDVFFVISGFLISSIILAELEAGSFSLVLFYERRARRILPALFFTLFVCLPFAWWLLLPSALKTFSESLIAVVTFFSNIFFYKQTGYFDTANELKPLIHTWSLAVEEQFYVLFPLFLMFAWKFSRYWIMAIVCLVALSSLGLAQWGYGIHKTAATFFLLPTRGWELLIGFFIAFVYTKNSSEKYSRNIGQFGSLIGLLLIIYSVFSYTDQTPFPSLYTLLPTIGAALIIIFATHKTVIGKLLGSKPFVAIGLVSYSAYLWHQPIFAFVRQWSMVNPSSNVMIGLSLFTFALAYLSWKYIEKPFRSRHRFSQNQIFSYGALCTVLFIGIGLVGYWSNGFLSRYNPIDRDLASLDAIYSGKYTQKKFNELLMRPFEKNANKLKILIIGDSYGQDLVNAIYESSIQNAIQISTRHIAKQCGNLFIDRKLFIENISELDRRLYCEMPGGLELFNDDNLRALMLDSDEIWFASSWQYWQAGLIKESVLNASSFSHKPIKIFGRKEFGKFEIKKLLEIDVSKRLHMRSEVSDETVSTNALLRSQISKLPSASFINIENLMCGEDEKSCPLFSDDGFLISYDGGHLTRSGAKLLGEQLGKDNLMKYLLNR
jgi:peptidoglycan/LPS O-acetylase OafA/YrhL